jgi:hypothetical protein
MQLANGLPAEFRKIAPGEQLARHKLIEICEACAMDLGFSTNQFVAIHHKDTRHQHLHIVVNRIGFDAKTLSDSNNYKKIAAYCRRMENVFDLKKVLSPKKYLSKGMRDIPRLDERKEQLKAHIKQCVLSAKNYNEFEQRMKSAGFELIKSRGIAFRDAQKVYTKGSDVGFSLSKIEKLLTLPPALKEQVLVKQPSPVIKEPSKFDRYKRDESSKNETRDDLQKQKDRENNNYLDHEAGNEVTKKLSEGIDLLMKHEQNSESIPGEFRGIGKTKRKQKRKGRSL